MSEHDRENPLHHLQALEPLALSEGAQAERRQRVVSRIDALRAELARTQLERPRLKPVRRVFAFVRNVDVRLKYTLAALVPLTLVLVLVMERPKHESQIFVQAGELTLHTTDGERRVAQDASWNAERSVVLSTGGTDATIVLPNHTALKFAPQTRVQLQSPPSSPASHSPNAAGHAEPQTLRLEHGAVTLSGNMSGERPLSVTTTHTLVQVGAATFALTIEQLPAADRTRVVVRAGDVSVWEAGREHRLTAGQEWVSTDVRSPVAQEPANAALPPTLGPSNAPQSAAPTDAQSAAPSTEQRSSAEPKTKGSDLALQNQLFESAQAARRAGQTELALQRFATLIRTYPASEQAHNARVEEFRLLRSLGRKTQASRSARAYLRAHPRGFAADEARRWLAAER